ncbi:SGNH/GDSL hydrolase family protein [Emticicia sp. 21SJ11W-3]|uniref:SGNH/GDSL hydrolase family protein n=1 Tax=Emticicia sp. 21SJ11W-3 TaxID=2916755 RepID=UPI00209C8CA9|nr:SGNH/GDSL hydrolase family protein [Emticicia sp. 21SJ11W-3]UTA68510.1 SGNH/GDSL hydrolase family protein [Emticicia sp. 21SJ11W-3]
MKKLTFAIVLLAFFSSFSFKELSWVAIGDSITYLNDHQKETDNRITKGYMTLVVERLPHIKYVNQGHNGWTSGGIANAIEKLNLTKADVYSIFLGTNDWWQSRPLGQLTDYKNNTGNNTVYGSFRIIIDKLRSLNPAAPIILITPMQRVDFVYLFNFKNNAFGSYKPKNGQTLESFAMAIDSIGKYEKFPVVDLYHTKGLEMENLVKFKRLKNPQTGAYTNYRFPDSINIPFNPETDEYPYPIASIDMTYDGLHPSDKGYELIASPLIKIMKRY